MIDRKSLLPSQREDAQNAAQQEIMNRAEARSAMMREDFTRTFQTESGKRVMAWLMDRCGFGKIILSADRQSGQLDPMMTTFAAMELNLYLEIRKHLPLKLTQEIEDGTRISPTGHITNPHTEQRTERITRKRTRSKPTE